MEQYGVPGGPTELPGHHILDKYHDPHSISWSRIIDTQGGEYRLYMRCNDFEALLKAAISGLGIVFLPNWVVGQDIKAGRLVNIFDDPQQKVDDIHFFACASQNDTQTGCFLQFFA
ncbi:LysR substrate-binding domain-containing protein [Klebsiella pneumoniae]|uniref:LysR substrate-binding domain-containing protein n=1 Tax=Klebsiella pneumoniae TaxID=573 RepID=UPI003D6DB93E